MSRDLPEALAPWVPALAPLAHDLALQLGAWLPRLALAFGPYRIPTSSRQGEPNGYDGLTRRGPYERLLTTEWLYAEELPEEFLRRSVMGEQGFLQLGLRTPAGSRRTTVLLDAGPSQLGAPRIAQLAALIVLEQRARAANAELQWGVLQSPPTPAGSLEDAGVRAFLAARSPRDPDAAMLERWRTALPPVAPGEAHECWVVGGVGAAALCDNVSTWPLLIEEPTLAPEPQLQLTLRRPGARAQQLTLELPPRQSCVRLLRDPFGTAVVRSTAVPPDARPASDLIVSDDGRRLIYLAADGALRACFLPNSRRAPATRMQRWRPLKGDRVLAAGNAGSHLHVLVRREDTLLLRVIHKKGSLLKNSKEVSSTATSGTPSWDAHSPLRPMRRVWMGERLGWWTVTWDDARAPLVSDATGKRVAFPGHPVLAMDSLASGGVRYAIWDRARKEVRLEILDQRYPHQPDPEVFPCESAAPEARLGAGASAVHVDAPVWTVSDALGTQQLRPPTGFQVLGVAHPFVDHAVRASLIALDPERRDVCALGGTHLGTLWRVPFEVERATVWAGGVVCASRDGELAVYGFSHRAVVLRMHTAQPEPDGGTA